MKKITGPPLWGLLSALLMLAILLPKPALAGTTGNITGTVTDASGKPVADVKVSAASLSQSQTTTTDANGFYSLINLTPDTYTLSFQKSGLAALAVPGITVQQDQTARVNETMRAELKTIANVTSSGHSNLVKPNTGSDVYTVGGAQLTAATNPTGSLETIYQFLAVTPGVTANGFPGQPRVRGGQVTDLGYEFEGIPIQDRMVGFFTSNLSNTGLSNVEVYTGGLSGAGAINGTGYFNSVLKTGTYPGFTTLSFQASSPEQNQYLTFEHGWATPDHRWSYYVGFTGVDSQNQYDYGENTYPNILFGSDDGPGPVKERNWVGNIHFRPNQKNDFQVVLTNDLGEFDFNYLLNRSPGQSLPLAMAPCPGATSSWPTYPDGGPSTGTFGQGGTAPNGQACPLGVYWNALGPGQGNMWHHYGGLGKLEWNHNINDHSFYNIRLDENFNQYIFDQPIADPNIPGLENPGDPYNWGQQGLGTTCPNYPYVAGTPVAEPAGDPYDECSWFDGLQTFYGDRRSNIYNESIDYTDTLSDRATLKAGVSDEQDHNIFDYYALDVFTVLPGGSIRWPGIYENASYPTNQQIAYGEADLRFGKLLVDPGLTWARRHYGFPNDPQSCTVSGNCVGYANSHGGGYTATILNPTFNGTYTFDPNNVLSFSYGNTTSFIGSAYLYIDSLAAGTGFDSGHVTRDPFAPGTSFSPQINHSAEALWEHNFGGNTTMRAGPYYNETSNYYATYQPFEGYYQTGCNVSQISGCIPCNAGAANCRPFFSKNSVLTNNNRHQSFGVEFGLNHVNNAPHGTSYWLSATYDNFWTNALDISGAYINSALPENIARKGVLVRSASNPLWTATFLADYHSDRFHLDPLVYYQGDTFFNTGDIHSCVPATDSNNLQQCLNAGGFPVAPYFNSNRLIAHGWWRVNLSAYEELGPKRNLILGVKVDNLLDQVTDTAPCPNDGTGCYPFDGPQSGVTGTASSYPNINWIYPNYSQSPRTFYFFAGIKM